MRRKYKKQANSKNIKNSFLLCNKHFQRKKKIERERVVSQNQIFFYELVNPNSPIMCVYRKEKEPMLTQSLWWNFFPQLFFPCFLIAFANIKWIKTHVLAARETRYVCTLRTPRIGIRDKKIVGTLIPIFRIHYTTHISSKYVSLLLLSAEKKDKCCLCIGVHNIELCVCG